jgi:undecaprenyl-diphosphatase
VSILHALILGLIQGLTEFIPVSSSGHLALLPKLFGWSEQSTTFDVVLHGGTLLALLTFFYPKLIKMGTGFLKKDKVSQNLVYKIIIGSIPAGILGAILSLGNKITDDKIDNIMKNDIFMITMLISVGILLILADYLFKNNKKKLSEISFKKVNIIGVTQCLSLIRGTSRSGITIIAGLSQKLTREEAAEFSFLMGIPLITMAFSYSVFELITSESSGLTLSSLIIGFIASFISGLIAIKFMLSFLKSKGLAVFGIYRIILALIAFYILVL